MFAELIQEANLTIFNSLSLPRPSSFLFALPPVIPQIITFKGKKITSFGNLTEITLLIRLHLRTKYQTGVFLQSAKNLFTLQANI